MKGAAARKYEKPSGGMVIKSRSALPFHFLQTASRLISNLWSYNVENSRWFIKHRKKANQIYGATLNFDVF